MTDNEIIKALECCVKTEFISDCAKCEMFAFDCKDILIENALDLINRQKAEIERLQKHNLVVARKHYDDGIKEFAEKVNELLERYSVIHENAEAATQDVIECDNEIIEMQSVWDVHTLIKNEMSEYEEMYRLQDNIENIAKERLLKEIEKDLRLLIKEMTEENGND